jgi:hypothetical protein
MFSSVVDVDRCPDHSYATAFNMAINLYMLLCGKELFPYHTDSLRWVSGSVTPSAHKNYVTACRCSLVHMESRVVMLNLLQQHYTWLVEVENISQSCRKFMLLPMSKISGTANTSFNKNNCGNFLTHI